MEIGTIVAALVALRYIKFTFLSAPIAFSLWFLSMDITPLIFHTDSYSWDEREIVSLFFGLAVIIISFLLDRRTKQDYSFWLYIFGIFAFWGGLSLLGSNNELGKFMYCLVNIGMIALSVWLERKVFIIFGAIGVFGYLSHLSYVVFKDSMLFPFSLSVLGLFIIYVAVQYQKKQANIDNAILSIIPKRIMGLRPRNREQ